MKLIKIKKIYAHILITFIYLKIFSSENNQYDLISNLAKKSTIVLKTIESNDCWISFIKSSDNEQFVVKQIKDPNPDEQFLLVLDALGCFIAQESNIPMNRVWIIAFEIEFPGKYIHNQIATLHSLAKGIPVYEKLPWPEFGLHQKFRKVGSRLWQKYGPLEIKKTGLTLKIIKQMCKHPILAKIAALDTFTGNADRSNPNIFYDSENNAFCGIDMAASFNTVLSEPACLCINNLIKSNVKLTKEELEGLQIYTKTLEKLINLFPIERLKKLLDEFAQRAKFKSGSNSFTLEVQQRIFYHKKIMELNYQHCLKLLKLLKTYCSK